MRRQGLPDAHQSSVRSSCHTGLPEIGVWGTKRETVHALVERGQGVHVVADDLQVVNHGEASLLDPVYPKVESAMYVPHHRVSCWWVGALCMLAATNLPDRLLATQSMVQQQSIFAASDDYERFMGRWSRRL